MEESIKHVYMYLYNENSFINSSIRGNISAIPNWCQQLFQFVNILHIMLIYYIIEQI